MCQYSLLLPLFDELVTTKFLGLKEVTSKVKTKDKEVISVDGCSIFLSQVSRRFYFPKPNALLRLENSDKILRNVCQPPLNCGKQNEGFSV